MMDRKSGICLECAEGGHLDEMMEILPALTDYDVFFLTTRSKTTESLCRTHRVVFIRESDPKPRSRMVVLIREAALAVLIAFRVLAVFVKEKPCAVISTGGSATVQSCIIGKLLGARMLSLQSVTRVNSLSMTGKLIYPMADLFLVQWEGLCQRYPRAKYWGKVL